MKWTKVLAVIFMLQFTANVILGIYFWREKQKYEAEFRYLELSQDFSILTDSGKDIEKVKMWDDLYDCGLLEKLFSWKDMK